MTEAGAAGSLPFEPWLNLDVKRLQSGVGRSEGRLGGVIFQSIDRSYRVSFFPRFLSIISFQKVEKAKPSFFLSYTFSPPFLAPARNPSQISLHKLPPSSHPLPPFSPPLFLPRKATVSSRLQLVSRFPLHKTSLPRVTVLPLSLHTHILAWTTTNQPVQPTSSPPRRHH